jgi:ankyrin repeat protein
MLYKFNVKLSIALIMCFTLAASSFFSVKAGKSAQKKDLNAAMHQAAINGDQHTVNLLLKQGINVNTQDICFFTPLIKASQAGNLSVVRQLIKAGALLNLSDKVAIRH